jgi:hypothetical protein
VCVCVPCACEYRSSHVSRAERTESKKSAEAEDAPKTKAESDNFAAVGSIKVCDRVVIVLCVIDDTTGGQDDLRDVRQDRVRDGQARRRREGLSQDVPALHRVPQGMWCVR